MPELDPSPTGFTRSQRWLTMVNLLAGTLALAAVLVMVNYLAAGHFKRFHWNNLASFKLSPLSQRVAQSLTNDVTISIFFNQANHGDVYTMVCGMLKEYQDANPQHIHVVNVDEERDFGEARALLERLHLLGSARRNFVAFESKGQTPATFGELELVHLNASDLANIRRDAFLGEIYFTSYIFNVNNPEPKKAYFLTGHGERDPGDPAGQKAGPGKDGVATLAAILKIEAGCDWGVLSLQGTNKIPADCQLLIIASPEKLMQNYSSNELALIQDYLLNNNGRLLALLNVDMGLNPLLLKNWGVFVDTNIVQDLDPNYRIGTSGFEALIHDVPNPIVVPLVAGRMTLQMYAPHPVFNTNNSTNTRPDAPAVDYLAGTSPSGTEGVHKGTFPLIASIQHGMINERNGTRIVVAGDADFLDDQLIDNPPGANHYFARQALNWLLQRPNLVLAGLGPRPIIEYRISVPKAQLFEARWLFLAVMPGSALFLGFLVWLRRRS
jgi:hypothetical protein